MWLPEDTSAALDWQTYESSLCQGCGHPRSESMAPENEGKYDTEPIKCHACDDRAKTAHKMAEDNKGSTNGYYFAVRHVDQEDDDGDA